MTDDHDAVRDRLRERLIEALIERQGHPMDPVLSAVMPADATGIHGMSNAMKTVFNSLNPEEADCLIEVGLTTIMGDVLNDAAARERILEAGKD